MRTISDIYVYIAPLLASLEDIDAICLCLIPALIDWLCCLLSHS